MSASPTVAVALKDVTKTFPGVVANDQITLDFYAGEVHVLLGENGAGKSTLIALLAGMQQPDSGVIEVAGMPVTITSPRQSLALGLGTVFQQLLLVPPLTVIENLELGAPWWQRRRRKAALARFAELSALVACQLDPHVRVERLSLGQQQQVEILRALWRQAKVLILDEPTSMLTPQGIAELGRTLGRLTQQGVAVILVTHKLREAFAFGNRISVLRQGRLVGQLDAERLQSLGERGASKEVISLMFGRAPESVAPLRRSGQVDRSQPPRLVAEGLSTAALPGECALQNLSLQLWPGEILGIAGIDGNGQKHLAEVLAGQRRPVAGRLLLAGADITHETVAERRLHGIAYVTDDRLGEGAVAGLSVATNLVLKSLGKAPLWRWGITRNAALQDRARATIAHHDIRTPSERTPLGRLSGGNIQKVLLARELGGKRLVLIIAKPTYGLDLHNSRLAQARIAAAAQAGRSCLLISTELEELLALSDRIAVLTAGRLAGIVDNGPDAEEQIGRLMMGAA